MLLKRNRSHLTITIVMMNIVLKRVLSDNWLKRLLIYLMKYYTLPPVIVYFIIKLFEYVNFNIGYCLYWFTPMSARYLLILLSALGV